MKKILVTGVSGFLGKFVVEEIHKNYELLITNYELKTDLTLWSDVEKLKDLEFEEIVHIAGVTSKNKDKYPEGFETNVIMMENMIKLAKIKKTKRIIFVSSNSVNYRTDEYANSKKKAEELLVKSGLKYVILRPTLILGSASAASINLKKWLKRLPAVPLPKQGGVRFSPIYPTDLARLIVKVIESKNNGIYTVGGERISYREYMEKVAGKKFKIVNINSNIFLLVAKIFGITTAKGMVEEIGTDNGELKRIYNWEPSTNSI